MDSYTWEDHRNTQPMENGCVCTGTHKYGDPGRCWYCETAQGNWCNEPGHEELNPDAPPLLVFLCSGCYILLAECV